MEEEENKMPRSKRPCPHTVPKVVPRKYRRRGCGGRAAAVRADKQAGMLAELAGYCEEARQQRRAQGGGAA